MEILQAIIIVFSFDMIKTFASFSGHTLSVCLTGSRFYGTVNPMGHVEHGQFT